MSEERRLLETRIHMRNKRKRISLVMSVEDSREQQKTWGPLARGGRRRQREIIARRGETLDNGHVHWVDFSE